MDGDGGREQHVPATERRLRVRAARVRHGDGQSRAVPIYRPARARAGSAPTCPVATTPLVGRELEQSLLIGHVRAASGATHVPAGDVVGEPGVGKSRLCGELFGYIEDRPGLVHWRQGRSSAVRGGDRVLGARRDREGGCGDLRVGLPGGRDREARGRPPRSDDPGPVAAGAAAAALGVGSTRLAGGVVHRLAPLPRVLASGRDDGARVRGRALGRRALLSFVEHLADWSQGVPLLLVCTARPELYEQHPPWRGLAERAADQPRAALGGETARCCRRFSSKQVCRRRRSGRCLSAQAETRCTRRSSPDAADRTCCGPARSRNPRRWLSGLGTGADRRPTRHAPSGAQAASAGRRGVGSVFWAGALVEMVVATRAGSSWPCTS